MKIGLIFASAVLVMGTAVAQNGQELPSAPSATVQPKTFPGGTAKPKNDPVPQTAPTQSTPPSTIDAAPQNAPASKPEVPSEKSDVTLPPAKGSTGQASADQEPVYDNPAETIRVGVSEVNLIFTVTDKHGRFIKDLKQDDLRILDDNRPPKSVVAFRSETDLPLRVGLLIDASNSIRDRFRFEQESAIEFLNQIVRPRQDLAFVLGFDSTAEVTQDFTDSNEKLSRGVRALRPGGGTALFDAIYYAGRDKLANARADRPVRKAIIILSDGDDNQSRVTREEAIEMAQRAEVIVYAISTNITGVKSRGDKVLERFAETTGGRVFFPYRLQDVANAFTEIQDELRSQYALAYKPEVVGDGRFHPIQIESVKNKNLKIRARKGYYASKQ